MGCSSSTPKVAEPTHVPPLVSPSIVDEPVLDEPQLDEVPEVPSKPTFEDFVTKLASLDTKTTDFVIQDQTPTADQVFAFCELISKNNFLRQLKLINVPIPPDSFQHLHLLFSSGFLDELVLSNCSLGTQGGIKVLELATTSTLSSLSLDNNGLDTGTVESICNLILKSPVLYRLSLASNKLSSEDLDRIHEATKSNAAIEQVIVVGNDASFSVNEETRLVL
ncbi:hypothetical protein RCL1_005075 [Eukaryota sp. TZLM3-RCL]